MTFFSGTESVGGELVSGFRASDILFPSNSRKGTPACESVGRRGERNDHKNGSLVQTGG